MYVKKTIFASFLKPKGDNHYETHFNNSRGFFVRCFACRL